MIALTVEADEDWKGVEMPDSVKSPEAPSIPAEQPPSAPVTMEIPSGQYDLLKSTQIMIHLESGWNKAKNNAEIYDNYL